MPVRRKKAAFDAVVRLFTSSTWAMESIKHKGENNGKETGTF
jgi:hypothetical protein